MKKILIGGSPCTHWSIAQKNNRETTAEGIGWELTKQWREKRLKGLIYYRQFIINLLGAVVGFAIIKVFSSYDYSANNTLNIGN